MKKTLPTRHTLRFRRWNRKAYAAFASVGRCVTIGCLRKSIADCSLSKQKATGSAGHAECKADSAWRAMTEGSETDIGLPLGGSMPLLGCGAEEAKLLLHGGTQPSDSRAIAGGQETYFLEQRNNSITDYQDWSSHSHRYPPC